MRVTPAQSRENYEGHHERLCTGTRIQRCWLFMQQTTEASTEKHAQLFPAHCHELLDGRHVGIAFDRCGAGPYWTRLSLRLGLPW